MSESEKELRIVIIEDEAMNRKIYKRILQMIFPRAVVEEAQDGEDGLEKIRANIPNLVILDLIMPRKNGLEVLAELSSDGILSEMIVVVVSGYPPEGRDFSEVLEYGNNVGFLQKPFGPETLMATVREYFSSDEK